jgi:hypothetical protein
LGVRATFSVSSVSLSPPYSVLNLGVRATFSVSSVSLTPPCSVLNLGVRATFSVSSVSLTPPYSVLYSTFEVRLFIIESQACFDRLIDIITGCAPRLFDMLKNRKVSIICVRLTSLISEKI